MRILGDVNLVTAATSAAIATVASFVVARAVTVRQARAKTREDARHTIMRIVAPLLGDVKVTIDGSRGQQPWRPAPRLHPLTTDEFHKDSLQGNVELLGELARATDDLGPLRRWRTRRVAVRAFGDLYHLAHLARWSTWEQLSGTALRAMIVQVPQSPARPGLWKLCMTDPTPRRLRMLEGALARLYGSATLLGPSPRVVPRWRRPIDRVADALGAPEREPDPRPSSTRSGTDAAPESSAEPSR